MRTLVIALLARVILAGQLQAQEGSGAPEQRVKLQVFGMHCKSCVTSIERSVRKMPGVDSVHVDMHAGFVEVRYDSALVRTEAITHTIQRAGYRVKGLIQ
jgi:copper ion binding protein